ncbi:tyrosine-type recombinase/integrase [Ruegeria conchae]|uniref:tyrosine-type recombinase/integrase n=1 Tax=Ruegeria conchae TaxID=981384 RepID=UPI0029C610ED|nr:tyrosine-type recombinase/integrase [Ruegeria conchae]
MKFRDDALRAALQAAASLAKPQSAAGRSHFEYEKLAPGGKLTCKANPGLLMRHGRRDGRVWFFRYRDDAGLEKELKLGAFPRELSVAEARVEAQRLRELHKSGVSLTPKEPEKNYTIEDLCEQYIAEYALGVNARTGEPIKRSGKEDARLLRRHIVPHHGQTPATNFDGDTIRSVLASLSMTAPREAQKVRAVLSTMFNVACGRTAKISYPNGAWLPQDHHNPTNGAMAPAHTTKTFCPDADQMKTFLEGLQKEVYGDALRLQLLTMTRVGEAAQAAWTELDLENALWHLPSTRAKNKHGYTIQLSDQAVTLLKRIKAAQPEGTEFVFPAPHDHTRPVAKANAIRGASRIRKNAHLPDGFSTHALRHAGLTWLKENLCPLDVRNAITNHRTKSQNEVVDGGYTKTADFGDLAREWLRRWAHHIDALQGQNVVKLNPTKLSSI